MKVLDVAGAAGDRFKGAEVFREHTEGQTYDEIVTYRSLSQMPIDEAIAQFKLWASYLNPGGVIHIFEPSAEWFAHAVLGDRVTPIAEYHLFGHGRFIFRSAWTMSMLRDMLAMTGLVADRAGTQDYVIGKLEGGAEVYAQEHMVIAFRPGGRNGHE